MRNRVGLVGLFLWLAGYILSACTPAPTVLDRTTSTPSAALAVGATASLPPVSTKNPTATASASPTAAATATLTPAPAASATRTPTATASATATALPGQVVVISLDGLRPDAVLAEQAAHIMALAARGAAAWQAQTVVPAATLPGHASMFSGLPPEAHGITWNDYEPARGTITVPTMLSIAHAAGLRTVLVVGKEKLAQLNPPGSTDVYVFVTNGDQGVADEAVAQVAAGFDLMVVHFPNPDYFGHLEGWMSPTYLRQLHRTDDAVGRLLAALPASTTVILTADHGGHDLEHGSRFPDDLNIPWIIAGPGVQPGTVLTGPVSVMDTAATALAVLGLALPDGAAGQVIGVGR